MVTVAIASLNTRHFTELAIRTAVLRAGCPTRVVVGDSGSTDGTLRMLDRLGRRFVDNVEVEPTGRYHGEWLDHWVTALDDEFVVFVDSDVEFRRHGWLVRMLQQQERENAAIVGAEWVDEWPFFTEPSEGKKVRLMGRPAPWVQLIHRPTVESLDCSYDFRFEPSSETPEGLRAYDVGSWVAAQATGSGLVVSVMPADFRGYFRHYRGRSWLRPGRRARLQHGAALLRLARVRSLHR